MTWENALAAGAFVLGAIAGATATVRITRIILEYMKREDRRQPPPPTTPGGGGD